MAPIRPTKLSGQDYALAKLRKIVQRRVESHSHPPTQQLTPEELKERYSLDDALLHETQRRALEKQGKNKPDKFLLRDLRVNKRKAKASSHKPTFQSVSSISQRNGHLPGRYPINGVLQRFLSQRVMTNPTTPYHFNKLAKTFGLIRKAESKGLFSPFSQKALAIRGHLEKMWPRFYTTVPSKPIRKTENFKSDSEKVKHGRSVDLEYPVPEYDIPVRRGQLELELLIPAKYEQIRQKAIERLPNVELLPEDLQERMAAVDAQLNSALENKDFYDVGMAPYDAQSAFRELRRLWYEFKDNPKVISEKQTSIQASPYRAPIISVLYEAKKCSTKALDGDSDNFQTQVSNHYATKDMTGIRKLARLEAKPYDQRGKDDLDSIKKLRLGL